MSTNLLVGLRGGYVLGLDGGSQRLGVVQTGTGRLGVLGKDRPRRDLIIPLVPLRSPEKASHPPETDHARAVLQC